MNTQTLSSTARRGFAFLAGINRPVNPSQVTKLANSISNFGTVLRPVIIANINFITGEHEKYIIDGQHLYTACLRLGINIPYIEIEIKDVKDLVEKIALLNSSSKSWVLMDYIKSWQVINSDYKILVEYFNRYDIEMSQLAQILHKGFASKNNENISKIIKSGSFHICNLDRSILLLDRITDMLNLVPRMDRISNKTLIQAFCDYAIHPDYNHDRTLLFITDNKSLFNLSTQDPEEFKKLFNQIA